MQGGGGGYSNNNNNNNYMDYEIDNMNQEDEIVNLRKQLENINNKSSVYQKSQVLN